jgi:ribosomal protein L34
LQIIIKPKTNVSDIKRQRKFGFNTRMKSATGRQIIMDKMLEGETFLAEY